MATQPSHALFSALAELRYEPTDKRIRAASGGVDLVDSRRAVLVWEPKRVVPAYAVPDADVHAKLTPAAPSDAEENPVPLGGRSVLDPSTPFGAHSCPGEPLSVDAGAVVLTGAAFRPDDPDLNGHVILDFDAFDQWLEEDEPIVGHPRDPFSRIDVRRSSSRVQIEVDGEIVADSTAPLLLFETRIATRYYLPRDDVRMELLTPTDTRTTCAYKGHASYWSVTTKGRTRQDLAWTYEEPLKELPEIAGYVAFFNERVNVILDGVRRERPITPWSRRDDN
jgi:uncharacterized protein (DUF427 family)